MARSIDSPSGFIQSNVIGTFNFLQFALSYYRSLDGEKKERFSFLHVSAVEVYESLESDFHPFTETTSYDPHSPYPYSASKTSFDHLAMAWSDTYGLPVITTNCLNNYGSYQFPENLIPVVLLNALSGKSIPIYGKGESIRDWLYLTDRGEALDTVLKKGGLGETYNIGENNELQGV